MADVQKDAEAISRLIKERITPLPQFILKPLQEDGKNLLALEVSPGRSTPYYYKADGVMEAYIRVGNESVIAPDYIVNELILKGTNQSFDTLTTEAVKKDYSFTLLEATYLERTGLRFEPSDYVSFGLADKNGVLTNAGKLMTDQHTVYNSRMFCTRWNGLEKGSIFDDALDDKEYEGNLIYLLNSGSEFIRNNSKVRFVKKAQYRVDKPDYAERAVTAVSYTHLMNRQIRADMITTLRMYLPTLFFFHSNLMSLSMIFHLPGQLQEVVLQRFRFLSNAQNFDIIQSQCFRQLLGRRCMVIYANFTAVKNLKILQSQLVSQDIGSPLFIRDRNFYIIEVHFLNICLLYTSRCV